MENCLECDSATFCSICED